MKKKIVTMIVSICAIAALAGCDSKTLSNEYITIEQYKKLEVPKTEGAEVTDEAVEAEIDSILSAAVLPEDEKQELTDEWVQQNSEASVTVEEYKAEIKKQMEEKNAESYNNTLRSLVLEALLEHVEVKKYPEDQVEDQVKTLSVYYQSMADSYSLEFSEFSKQYLGMTEDEFNKQIEETAQQATVTKLACELIADKQKIKLSDDQSEMKEYAESEGYGDLDTLLEQVDEDELKTSLLQQKVADYLIESCVQVEQNDTTTVPETETTEADEDTEADEQINE